MVALSEPRWIQGAFSTLLGLFDRVGLKTNVGKTVGMVYCLFQVDRTQLKLSYRQRMMGVDPSYR